MVSNKGEVTCERDNVEFEELGAGKLESENFILDSKGGFESLFQNKGVLKIILEKNWEGVY